MSGPRGGLVVFPAVPFQWQRFHLIAGCVMRALIERPSLIPAFRDTLGRLNCDPAMDPLRQYLLGRGYRPRVSSAVLQRQIEEAGLADPLRLLITRTRPFPWLLAGTPRDSIMARLCLLVETCAAAPAATDAVFAAFAEIARGPQRDIIE